MAANKEATYIAFAVSEDLEKRMEDLITNIRTGNPVKQIDQLIDVGIELTDEAMQAFLIHPLERVRLNPLLRGIANMGITTIKKAMHSVVRKTVKKYDTDQVMTTADIISAHHCHGRLLLRTGAIS